MISPYHMPHKEKVLTDLLVTVDEDYKFGYQSKKLICKLRELSTKDDSYIFYREYPKK
jgi:hypothetical protein